MIFRLTLIDVQDGKMEEAMAYGESKIEEFVGTPGLFQIAICENSVGQIMSWSTWADEDAMNAASEQIQQALSGLKDFVTGPPTIKYGTMKVGQQYVNIMKGDREGQSFVVRMSYGSEYIDEKYDEGMDWLQNTVYTGYEGTDGLLGAFAADTGTELIGVSNWDSQDAMDASQETYQEFMKDAENYIKTPPTVVTGECNLWRNMVSFPAGKLSEWSK